MSQFVRASVLALTLLAALSFGNAGEAQARTSFSFSVGVPLYYGGYHGRGWYGAGLYSPSPYFYRPFYAPRYYGPSSYGPSSYAPPAYRPRATGPIFSLGLFPASVGDAMTMEDRDFYFGAYQRALTAPVGEPMTWRSAGASGSVTITRDGWAGQRYCREFRQDISIGGRAQEAIGTACQTANGDWQLVQNQ